MTSKNSNGGNRRNAAQDLNTQLNNLCEERAAWETGAYKKSNDQLYAILGKCLDIYQQLRDDLKQRKVFKERLDALKLNKEIEFTESTNLPTRIVRYVFRNSGKRSLAYAKVIIAANEANIDSLGLAAWITKHGGVEQLRRKDKNDVTPAMMNSNLRDKASAYYAGCDGIVTAFKAPKELLADSDATNTFSLALVRQEADGQVTIVYGTNKTTLVNTMLTYAGKHLAENQNLAAAGNKRRAQKAALRAAIKAA